MICACGHVELSHAGSKTMPAGACSSRGCACESFRQMETRRVINASSGQEWIVLGPIDALILPGAPYGMMTAKRVR